MESSLDLKGESSAEQNSADSLLDTNEKQKDVINDAVLGASSKASEIVAALEKAEHDMVEGSSSASSTAAIATAVGGDAGSTSTLSATTATATATATAAAKTSDTAAVITAAAIAAAAAATSTSSGASPYVSGASPYVSGASPYVSGASPYVSGASPYVSGASPYTSSYSSQYSYSGPPPSRRDAEIIKAAAAGHDFYTAFYLVNTPLHCTNYEALQAMMYEDGILEDVDLGYVDVPTLQTMMSHLKPISARKFKTALNMF